MEILYSRVYNYVIVQYRLGFIQWSFNRDNRSKRTKMYYFLCEVYLYALVESMHKWITEELVDVSVL